MNGNFTIINWRSIKVFATQVDRFSRSLAHFMRRVQYAFIYLFFPHLNSFRMSFIILMSPVPRPLKIHRYLIAIDNAIFIAS